MPPVETLLRLLILVWLLTWLSTVPLFHLHIPDITDQWSTLQSGGAHTVLTPDLPGEFFRPLPDNHQGHVGHLSHRVVNSPELGIALFNEDRKAKALNILGAPYRFPDTPPLSSLISEFPGENSQLPLSQAFPASRAPPRMVCV